MSEREHLYSCEHCSKRIYEGDQVCTFYTEARFCAEHAMKRSDALREYQNALIGTYSPIEGEDFDEAAILQRIAELELQIAREGDCPAALVAA